jgi:hypothetical protein
MREVMERRRSWVLDAGLVILCAGVPILVDGLRGLERTGFDLGTMFIPNLTWWWSAPRLLGGWNPWIFGGFPANADPLVAKLHPLGALYALTSPLAAASLDGFASTAIAGLGMLAYLRTVSAGRVGSLVGSISFAMGGFVAAHAPHPPLQHAAMAIPWALAAIERLKGARLVAAVGASAALIALSGHPQTTVYSLMIIVLYALRFGSVGVREQRVTLVLGLAVGIATAAAIWLPALELIRLSAFSTGGEGPLLTFTTGKDPNQLSPEDLLSLFIPFASGGGVVPPFDSQASPRYWACNIIECAGYPGMMVWLFIVGGAPFLMRTRHGRFWLLMGTLALLLSSGILGRWPPLHGVRAPARFLLWWSLSAAALAGIAARNICSPRSRDLGDDFRSKLTPVLPIALLAGLIGFAWMRELVPASIAAASCGLLALSAIPLMLTRTLRSIGRPWICVAAISLDLILFNAAMPLRTTAPKYPNPPDRNMLPFLSALVDQQRVPALRLSRSAVVPQSGSANWASLEGVRLIQGGNRLATRSVVDLLGIEPGVIGIGALFDPDLALPSNQVLNLMRCRYVAIGDPYPVFGNPLGAAIEEAAESGSTRWQRIGTGPNGRGVYENNDALPVAWIVGRVRVVPVQSQLALVKGAVSGESFDPTRVVLASAPIPGVSVSDAENYVADRGKATARVLDSAEDEIRLVTESAGNAVLVTSELAYPGWKATIDGEPTEIYLVNAGFRAIPLPEGRHEITFSYKPGISHIGLGISAVGAAVLATCALTPWRRKRRLL